jgi:hypothetical protein
VLQLISISTYKLDSDLTHDLVYRFHADSTLSSSTAVSFPQQTVLEMHDGSFSLSAVSIINDALCTKNK